MQFLTRSLYLSAAFLVLTNLFVFFSAWTGVSLTFLGGGLALGTGAFLFLERQTASDLLRKTETKWVIVILLVWPLLYALYTMRLGVTLKREIVLQVFYVVLVLATMVYIRRSGFLSFRRLIIVSFWVSVLGIVLDLFFPGVFYRLAADGEEVVGKLAFGRAGGFFLNPNNAGRFLILMYLFILMNPRRVSIIRFTGLSTVLMLTVLLTGSRSSLLICGAAIIAVLIVKYSTSRRLGRFQVSVPRLVGSISLLGLLSIGSIFLVVKGANVILEKTEAGMRMSAASRYDMFTTGMEGFVDTFLAEAGGRFETVTPYLERFRDSYLIGNGMAGMRIYKERNGISLVPHNTFFLLAFDYGILYPIVLTALAVLYCFGRTIRRAEFVTGLAFSPIFMAVLLLISFTYDALFSTRGMYIVFGALLALRVCPESGLPRSGRDPGKARLNGPGAFLRSRVERRPVRG